MMRMALLAAGVFNFGLAVFHLFFWRLFRWQEELPGLSAVNRGIMPVLNLCLTFVLFFFAALCLLFPSELIASELGGFLLFGMCVFWKGRSLVSTRAGS